jgi:hypothetical protein
VRSVRPCVPCVLFCSPCSLDFTLFTSSQQHHRPRENPHASPVLSCVSLPTVVTLLLHTRRALDITGTTALARPRLRVASRALRLSDTRGTVPRARQTHRRSARRCSRGHRQLWDSRTARTTSALATTRPLANRSTGAPVPRSNTSSIHSNRVLPNTHTRRHSVHLLSEHSRYHPSVRRFVISFQSRSTRVPPRFTT